MRRVVSVLFHMKNDIMHYKHFFAFCVVTCMYVSNVVKIQYLQIYNITIYIEKEN